MLDVYICACFCCHTETLFLQFDSFIPLVYEYTDYCLRIHCEKGVQVIWLRHISSILLKWRGACNALKVEYSPPWHLIQELNPFIHRVSVSDNPVVPREKTVHPFCKVIIMCVNWSLLTDVDLQKFFFSWKELF